jgi:hypothetical protein
LQDVTHDVMLPALSVMRTLMYVVVVVVVVVVVMMMMRLASIY